MNILDEIVANTRSKLEDKKLKESLNDLLSKIDMDNLGKNIFKKSLEGEKTCGTHYDVANVIADYYKNEFVCSGLKENFWYYFNESKGGKWEPTEVGHELRKKLSNEIVDIYLYYAKKYQNLSEASEEDSIQKKIYDQMVANCGKIISKLKDSTYKDKIIRECRELFYDEEFDEKINSNFDLIGFDNGVFGLYEMPGNIQLSQLSVSTKSCIVSLVSLTVFSTSP